MPDPYLRCAFELQAGSLRLQADFNLHAPWTCLFGPSGSGKTTILRTIAGFLHPQNGLIALAPDHTLPGISRTLSGISRPPPESYSPLLDTSRRIFVPAHLRPFRTVAQQAWLFPGSVRGNLRYGLSAALWRKAEDEVLQRFELAALASSHVRTLSGGQRQRVSLARTVASALYARVPVKLLLLDEPFTGLDLDLRTRLALDLRAWLAERHLPVLSVTHDVPEVLLLQADTLRIQDGRVIAHGPAESVLAPERAMLLRTLRGQEM